MVMNNYVIAHFVCIEITHLNFHYIQIYCVMSNVKDPPAQSVWSLDYAASCDMEWGTVMVRGVSPFPHLCLETESRR